MTILYVKIKLTNMNKAINIFIFFVPSFAFALSAYAIETSPHISDREIVESLSMIRGDIKRLEDGQKATNTRIDDLRSEMNGRFEEVDHRFEEVNHRLEEVNHRFDTLQWMLGLFITIALVILGFVLRMQWQMHRRQTKMETILESQREEIGFIRGLMEKLLQPRGVL